MTTPPPHPPADHQTGAPGSPPAGLPPTPRILKYVWAAGLTAAVLSSAVVETVAPGHPSGPPLRALIQILACPRMAETDPEGPAPVGIGPDLSAPAAAGQ